MNNKMTLVEFQNYIKNEAHKLLKIETLKEEKNQLEKQLTNLNESTISAELGHALMDEETLKKVRQEMLKKAVGWAFPEPPQLLPEWDEKAMQAAKSDIESSGEKFVPLGKSNFEKHLDKKELGKAMSPESEKNENSAPSAGLSAEKKSDVVKSAKAGEDIGHKGKGFADVAANAAKEYGSKEAGEKVAAAAMWKNMKRESEDHGVKEFKFKVAHDNGFKKLKTKATDLEAAKKIIMSAEGCPENAITHVA